MGCGCNKEKPKGGGKSFTKAVVEIVNPEKITLLRKVVIPASLGDETTIPPAVGLYRNVVLCYEASKRVYLYSSDGIPTFISTDLDAIEDELERLGVAIEEEAEAREQADSELEDSISDLSDALAAEVSARVAGDAELEDTVSTHTSQISDLSTGLSNEIDNRQSADTNLQSQIDAISAASDVKDIVGTHAELEAYDTTQLGNNDIIKVLQDETQDDATTYYRWSTSTQEFTLIGEEGPYYTKSQTDDLLTDKQNVLTAGNNITITGDTISATDTTYSAGNGLSLNGTTFSADTTVLQPKLTAGNNISITNNTISATDTTYTAGSGLDLTGTEFSIDNTVALKTDLPTVNNAVFTVQKNGVDVASFTANSAVDATANITVPTDTAQLTNTAGYQTASDVASAISGKQDTLTPGNNIQINGNTISATNTTYSAGNGLDLTGTVFSADTDILQTKLTPGTNITIQNGVISSTGGTYTAGNGLELTNNEFSIDDSIVALKSDIPVISSASLTIQRNGTDVATFTTDSPNPVTANILVPTNNAQLTNGAGYQTASDVQSLISGKQDTLTPGTNIQINGSTISATDTKYSAGTGLNLTGTVFSADTTVLATQSDLSGKQDTLTPGSNITITNNTISATDTTYSDFDGADASTAGTAGLVPAPAAGDNTKFLSGDGTWKTVSLYDLPIASANTLGGIKVGSGLSIDSTTGVLSATATPITLYNSTGQNTDGAMTQKAVTDALSLVDSVYSDKNTSQGDTGGAVYIGNLNSSQQEIKDPTVTDSHYKYFWALPSQNLAPYNNSVNILGRTGGNDSIALGQAIANTQYAIAIGSVAQVYGVADRGVAIGTNAIATKANSVALGAYAKTDRIGEVNVGTGTSGYGYNNTNYRIIGGVHDPVNAQDAATKNYVDTHIPTIPTNVSDFVNDAGYITNTVNNLTNYTPTSALATVATSGSYNDLTNKPTIPAAQVNSDWDATGGVAEILNKPTIPTKTSDLTNDGSDNTAQYLETDETAYRTTSIPYGECDSTSTSTVFTATVPGITELRDGVCMWLKNGVVTSASGFTININGLGAKPVYSNMAAATRDTTLWNVAYTMLFVYDSDRVEGGCWVLYRGYDANTNTIGYQVRTNSQTLPMSSITYRYRLLFTSADGEHYVPANNSTSTNATASRTVCQDKIDPFGSIFYYGTTASVAADSRPAAAYLWQQYAISLGYSFNRTGAALTLTSYKPVYVKAAPQSDGSAIIDSTTPYVQDLPTTEDGYIYIFLGVAYSATNIELEITHPVYYYKDGMVRLYTNPAAQRITVDSALSSTSENPVQNKVINSALGSKANSADLSTVATSGSYNDLTNKPTIPAAQVNSDWNSNSGVSQILNKPTLATVATSGSYNDLTNKPTIPTVPTNVSAFTNDAGYQNSTQVQTAINSAISGITGFEYQVVQTLPATGEKGVIYLVPNSGSAPNIYDEYIWIESGQSGSFEKIGTTETDLSGYVTDGELQTALADYTETADLATVATSGSYNDLTNKPTIPAAQVNSDWNATSGVAQILNKPTIPTVPTAGTTASAVSTTASGGSATTWSKSDHVHSISSSTITSALGYTPYNSTNPNGYTSNTGTITGVSANGTSVATSGVANIPAATTGRYGVTQLSSATNSSSTSLAATASAVKAAYDLANGKQDPLTAGTGIDITNGVISATAVANTFASYQNGTLYITNSAQNADTENF